MVLVIEAGSAPGAVPTPAAAGASVLYAKLRDTAVIALPLTLY
jgi:hypothetical protein